LTHLPVLAVIAPLFYAFLMPLLEYIPIRVRRTGTVLFAAGQIVLVLLMIPQVVAEGVIEYHVGGWVPPIGIVLVVDGFSLLFALLAAVGIGMVILYSLDYVDRREYRYFVLLFLVQTGVTGMLLTGDMFNLYVFFELASMASFPLIAFAGSRIAVEAALRYLVYSTIAAAFILLAIGLVYGATGTLNLRQAAVGLASADALVRSMVLGLLLTGLAIKVALVPFHVWLPVAHSTAPAPVSALLSGVMLKIAVYAIVRLLLAFGHGVQLARLEFVLLNLGTLAIVVGHWLALGQSNFKKTLAWSSIAHVGIIVTGMGLGTVQGMAGALFHSINHMFMKSLAFFAVGRLGRDRGFEMADMKGTGWRTPLAAAALIASALSLTGLPPLAGFIGKWEITVETLRERHFVHAAAIPFGTLLSAIYLGRMVRVVFGEAAPGGASREPGGLLTGLVFVMGTAGCLVPFVLWDSMWSVVLHVASLVFV